MRKSKSIIKKKPHDQLKLKLVLPPLSVFTLFIDFPQHLVMIFLISAFVQRTLNKQWQLLSPRSLGSSRTACLNVHNNNLHKSETRLRVYTYILYIQRVSRLVPASLEFWICQKTNQDYHPNGNASLAPKQSVIYHFRILKH